MSFAQIFMEGGPLMFPLALIVLVLIGIIIRTVWHLYIRNGSDAAIIQNCLDGLLFWGGFAVIIGILGSAVGYHKAMTAIVRRGLVNPVAVWIGSAEGMVTSITGLLILAGAGVSWYLLRWQHIRGR